VTRAVKSLEEER